MRSATILTSLGTTVIPESKEASAPTSIPASCKMTTPGLIEKIVKCNLKVDVSSAKNNKPENLGINEILKKSKDEGKSVIFTFTPGPFREAKDIPASWMKTEPALGCTAQLTAFDKNIDKLDAAIYAVNKHKSSYQCGVEGLLAKKNLQHLSMISDENNVLEKEFGLSTITVDGMQYIARFSVVIRPDGTGQVFELSSPVDAAKAAEHIEAIKQYIGNRSEANINEKRYVLNSRTM